MTQYGPGERSKKEGANEGTPSQKLHMPMLSTKVGCVWGIVTAIAVRTLWRMLAHLTHDDEDLKLADVA